VEVDHFGQMTGFTEKPPNPLSDLANAGMYAFNPSLLRMIDDSSPNDIGHHLLPRLVGRARVLPVDGYFCDIGTPAAYHRAIREWQPKVLS
jgi:mannose-1-phosphate guanylyltransferase